MTHRDTVNVFTSVTGFCEKSKEILDVTSSGDRIRSDDNNFKGNDNSPHSRKITYKKIDVSEKKNPQTTILELKKLQSMPAILTNLPGKPHCRFLRQTNSGSQEKQF